jgi:hypothetical protein
MTYYSEDSLLIVGNSRTTSDNPITLQYSPFFLSLVVGSVHGELRTAGPRSPSSDEPFHPGSICPGGGMIRDDALIVAQGPDRYHGSSQKAIVAAYKDAVKKFPGTLGK